jgi:hypothetical protein
MVEGLPQIHGVEQVCDDLCVEDDVEDDVVNPTAYF